MTSIFTRLKLNYSRDVKVAESVFVRMMEWSRRQSNLMIQDIRTGYEQEIGTEVMARILRVCVQDVNEELILENE